MKFFKKKPKVPESFKSKTFIESVMEGKKKVVLGEMICVTPGKRHAWYESNVGIIKKPISLS